MDTETLKLECELTNVSSKDRKLVIDWADGHQSRFHFLWLRDACQCEHCGIPGFGDRPHAVVDIPEDVHPSSAKIGTDGSLLVEWSDNQHRSSYDGQWLRAHCYSERERERRRSKPTLWDNIRLPELTSIEYERLVSNETTQFDLLERLRRYGIAIISNAPALEGVAGVAGCIGILRETNYGHVYDSKLEETPETFAGLTAGAPPHTDDAPYPPGLIMLHCVQPTNDGGGASVFIDGFEVVERLQKKDPEAVEVLSRLPTAYHRVHPGEHEFLYNGRMVNLDHEGRLTGVRLTTHSTGPPDLPEDQIESYYAAVRKMTAALRDPEVSVVRFLTAGEIAITDNERVLHGRTPFTSGSARHIRGGMVDKDGMISRWRVLAKKLGKDPNMSFPGGVGA